MEKHNLSFEPMDVDLSGRSGTEMDISDNKSDAGDKYIKEELDCEIITPAAENLSPEVDKIAKVPENVKTFHIIKKEPNLTNINTKKVKLMYIIIVIVVAVAVNQLFNIRCSEEMDLGKLQSVLSKQVFGQSRATDKILTALQIKGSKVIFMYGGTGVGKTYTASLIMEIFGYFNNSYHFTMPSFAVNFSTDFLLGLVVCKTSLFVIDDLSLGDKDIKLAIKDLTNKSQNLEKNITIILIYSCENTNENYAMKCGQDFDDKLKAEFNEINVHKEFIKFEPLSVYNLRQCIEKEIKDQNIKVADIDKITKDFNVEVDGCKGVHMKIKML